MGLAENLLEIINGIVPIPDEWVKEASETKGSNNVGSMDCISCSNYRELVVAWRKALKWTDGLDHALAVMLASIASTKSIGDQLWIKVIGPASCGKSTLCEAISVNRDYVLAKSTIRGFHSGFKTDGQEDHSLVSKLYGKTLVTKDGDTLLQSPNLGQILAEARDLYDSTSRTHYRNSTSRDYAGVRMTWLLCGTSSLRQIDQSELGERFLDCVIMEKIDEELEDDILWRVVNRADRNVSVESNGRLESCYEGELAQAMQLTGGYVSWLRENAAEQLSVIHNPRKYLRYCASLGKFVAYMRARPSIRQEEKSEREFAARLASQMVRLSKCLALVLNREEVDQEVVDRVRQVAMDTARGQTLEITDLLFTADRKGMEAQAVASHTNRPQGKTWGMLRFLRDIGVTEPFTSKEAGSANRIRWRLNSSLQRLYKKVMFPDD